MTTSPDRVMRIPDVTPAQWRALRMIAAERDLSLGLLVTTALQTAPGTRRAFTTNGKGKS